MKTASIIKIRKSMEKSLDSKRFEHTLGVAYTAAALAMCYNENILNAEIAGMLHDCAKGMDNDKKLSICEKHHIQISATEIRNPFLLHAKVGSYIAMKKYGIRDQDVINAILSHTTGRPNMSLLEKIVFVADYIEPCREQAPNLTELRALAFKDLDKAFLIILKDTLEYLNSVEGEVDLMTQKTYDYYTSLTNTAKEE